MVCLKSILDNTILPSVFITLYLRIAMNWSKSLFEKYLTGTCAKTPSKMQMPDMVMIDAIVFEIVVWGGGRGIFTASTTLASCFSNITDSRTV